MSPNNSNNKWPLGVFASMDPVALDKACVDLAARAPGTPGSAAEDYGASEAGERKFTAASAVHCEGLSEEIQIETGAINGLGTKEYQIVDVEPLTDSSSWGFPDHRPLRTKFGPLYAKEDPFPRDRFDGRGYNRVEEVDLDRVSGDGA